MAWAYNSPGYGGHRPLTYRGSLGGGGRRAPPTTQKERKRNPGTAPLLTTHNPPPITMRPPHSCARVFRECTRPQTGRARRGRGGGRGRARFGVWHGSTAALAVGGDTRRSLWHSAGLHCDRQINIGVAGGVPVVAIRLGGRRRRLVEWLGVEELNRSQHTQQLRQTRSITPQQPHANPHADGARAGGSTIFGAGAGARSGLLLSLLCFAMLALESNRFSTSPQGRAGVTACSPLPTRPWRVDVLQRRALRKVPYILVRAGRAGRRWQKCFFAC